MSETFRGLIGIDEVGRGCWAGPLLVVAARNVTNVPTGLTDSKKLTKNVRERIYYELTKTCSYGEGWVWPAEIDLLGLTGAMKLGVTRALEALGALGTDEIIMDGNYNYCPEVFSQVKCIVKADGMFPEVSAASVIAKVKRDNYMAQQAEKHPAYGFEAHVGYGTAKHVSALQEHGITELHRLSFKPLQQFI